MLQDNEIKKVEKYLDDLLDEIASDAKKNINQGMSDKEVIDKTVSLSVNKLTPECKMIISSVCYTMQKETLKKEMYNNPSNKFAFRERNIIKEISDRFDFTVPDDIDWETNNLYKTEFGITGGVSLVGAIASMYMKSVVPFCISVAPLIGVLMVYILKEVGHKSKSSCMDIVEKYLGRVKNEILTMIDQVQAYYDAEVNKFESELKKNVEKDS